MPRRAILRLLESYTDFYGCVGLYPQAIDKTKGGEFDSENRNFFTGQAALLCKINNIEIPEKWFNGILKNQVSGGIYKRSPLGFPSAHRISHDEYLGICMMFNFFDDHIHSEQILKHGLDHNWVYSDLIPHLKNPFKDFGAFRQPSDRVLIKVGGHKKPSWIDNLWLLGGVIAATRKPKSSTSSKIMAFCRLKTLELLGYDNFFIRLARKRFDTSMSKMYGESYVTQLYKIYFNDTSHPFHNLVPGRI